MGVRKTVEKTEFYKEADFIASFKLPSMKSFGAKSLKTNPIHKFYKWLTEKLGVKPEFINVDIVYVGKEAHDALKKELKLWSKMSKKRIDAEVGMFWWNYGPKCFKVLPEWADKNRVYIRSK